MHNGYIYTKLTLYYSTKFIWHLLRSAQFSGQRLSVLRDAAARASLPNLKSLILRGCAYHHAGLSTADREVVENLFLTGHCKILTSTSTLAMGVNLPAHLVVIKGTKVYRGDRGTVDIETSDLLQMMGRAGRPGFDTSGVAVIMTDEASVTKYENLSTKGLDVIESQIGSRLTETINTEVSQKVIGDVSQAIGWLKSTFFYIRVKKNPTFYKMVPHKVSNTHSHTHLFCLTQLFANGQDDPTRMDTFLRSVALVPLQKLDKSEIVTLDEFEFGVEPTEPCHIMSKHLVPYASMVKIMGLGGGATPPSPSSSSPSDSLSILDLLHDICQCSEIQIPLRRSDKKLLNELHKQVSERALMKTRNRATTKLTHSIRSARSPPPCSI